MRMCCAGSFFLLTGSCSACHGVLKHARAVQDFRKFLSNDRELLHASRAHWVLVPAASANTRLDSEEVDSCDVNDMGVGCNSSFLRIALPEGSVQIGGREVLVGSEPGSHIHVDCTQVSARVLVCATGRTSHLLAGYPRCPEASGPAVIRCSQMGA